MTRRALVLLALLVTMALAPTPVASAKVVHENVDDLPPACDEIAGRANFTVRAGREHAAPFPGVVFTFDEREYAVEPCTLVTVRFVNEDAIRHQFMVHGTWPNGFFQLEVDGPGEATGSFIVGADPKTRLVHCGIPQHQQKGMKAQLLVAGGEGVLPNIPGVSGLPPEDRPRPVLDATGDDGSRSTSGLAAGPFLAVLALAAIALRRGGARHGGR